MHDFTKYFKEYKGFNRFITCLYKKYKSYGTVSGFVKLNNISNEESVILSRFFGQNYIENTDIKISISKFLKIMSRTKFTDFDVLILIKEYLSVDLKTNKELKEEKINDEIEFYRGINSECPNDFFDKIISNKSNTYKLVHQKYLNDSNKLKTDLINIINLVKNLPNKMVLLPIYSSLITKNPHYLDIDTSTSNFFITFLSEVKELTFPQSRIEKIIFLHKFNLEIDNISNYVVTYNLKSSRNCINNFLLEPLILNIYNILNTNDFNGINNKIFIFENPSILTEIISNNINASVIITNGFANYSLYLLLDKIKDCKFYYNGDFDPEGLIIADKLVGSYENLVLFGYDEQNYKNSISDNIINKKRLSKLNNINSKELFEVKEKLLEYKLPGYQENNKKYIIDFIKSTIN